MIPIRDENPTRTTPYVVYTIIILNILLFITDQIMATRTAEGIRIPGLWQFYMIPKSVVTGVNWPAVISSHPSIQPIPHPGPHPTWLTLFTSMFLHANWLHIGGNMWFLWIFGNNIEDVLGHFKFTLFYLIGGALGGLTHILSNPMSQVPTLGASGAIAAVMGAYIVLYPRSRVISLVILGFFVTTVAVPAVVVLGLWIGLQILNGIIASAHPGVSNVAYWAHIGGFAAGMLLILIVGGRRLLRYQWRRQPYGRYR